MVLSHVLTLRNDFVNGNIWDTISFVITLNKVDRAFGHGVGVV